MASATEARKAILIYKSADGGLVEARWPLADPVIFWPQGGGFQAQATREIFLKEFTQVSSLFDFKQVVVSGEWFPLGFVVDAYANGMSWNGWAKPLFTFESAMKILAVSPNLRYDAVLDAFIAKNDCGYDDESDEIYESLWLPYLGSDIKVYPVGTGSWCWDTED
jgi:hypothetical protein